MKKLYAILFAILCFGLVPKVQADHLRDHLLFSAKLDGAQETPAVSTSATGVGSLVLNRTRDTMFVSVTVAGLSGAITGAHIHEGLPGVPGAIVVNLMPWLSGNKIMGYLTGADLTPVILAKYLNGLYYINVHTAANPNGEIRGQILMETDLGFSSRLTGAQEVPAVTTNANGTGVFMLSHDRTKLRFYIIYEGLSGTPTAAHFHTGAPGVAGPIVSHLTTFINGNTIVGEVDPTTFLIPLLTGGVYINIHTGANPNGEIRGQLKLERGLTMDAQLTGAQEIPPVTTNAKGIAGVRISSTLDSIEVLAQMSGLSGAITAAHFHSGAAGISGPVVINLTPLINGNSIVGKLSLSGVPAGTLNMFLRGEMYLNVHTAANPNGEIRGQVYRLAREGYTFAMNGKQETPSVTTAGYGSGLVSIDRDQTNAHFMMVWGGLSGPATAAHFHKAIAGVAGPIIFHLTPFFNNTTNPTGAFGYWTAASTPAFATKYSVAFRTDSMYVNVHTAANPGGEIRGQVLRGAMSLTKILSITPESARKTLVAAYPNPSNHNFRIKVDSEIMQAGILKVTDLLGRVILEEAYSLNPGKNEKVIEMAGAKPGIYQMEYISAESHLVSRLVKF
jgi:hypothetical protein